MPELSRRSGLLPASPIRKLAPLANAAKARGTKVYHLNIGQPDIPTPETALDALRHIDRKILEYSPSEGYPQLREAMAAYYQRFAIDVSAEEITVTAGGSEALLFAFQTCMDPGDELIMTEPTYANYLSFAAAAGITVKSVPAHIENGFALPPIEEFEKQITPRTRAILICNPNNPTGYVYSPKEMEQIRDLVLRHNLFLLSDEVYREFCYTETAHVSAFHLRDLEQHTVMIDSVSKRYSECGIRIGALVSKNETLRNAALKLAQARLSPPLLGQIVAAASFERTPPSYMKAVYDEYLARRDFLVNALNRIPNVFSPLPKGAFYTIARLPVSDIDDFCAWLLTDFSYKGATVMLAPASGFYSDKKYGYNEARLAYVLNISEMEKAMEILQVALEAYPLTLKKG